MTSILCQLHYLVIISRTLPIIVFHHFLVASFTSLLRETVAEFTLADHKGATTTSMLQSLCHKDDSILLGAWVQDTDHRKVEEQV